MRKLVLFILFIATLSCKKSEKPNYAESYANYYADGKYISHKGTAGFLFPNGVGSGYLFLSNGKLSFNISCEDSSQLQLASYSDPVTNVKFKLVDSSSFYSISGSSHYYTFDSLRSYIMFSTIDNFRITGTFECHGVNNLGQGINITNGNFNVVR